MLSPSAKLKLFVSSALLFAPQPSLSLDESRLWLPKKYQTQYLSLVKAAKVAEALDRCVDVLEGTLDFGQSTKDHPVYRILCRQENQRNYNEMVDGLSFEPLTTVEIPEPEISPEQQEARRKAEEARKKAEEELRKLNFWQMCHAAIMDRTKMMINLKWLSEPEPEPKSFDENGAVYEVNFNAESIWGKALKYRAVCEVSEQAGADLKLLKRRD